MLTMMLNCLTGHVGLDYFLIRRPGLGVYHFYPSDSGGLFLDWLISLFGLFDQFI